MNLSNNNILLVEDDPDITDLVNIHLNDMGFDLDHASDGNTGLDLALNHTYTLIILDLMLPGLDGIDICKKIRAKDSQTPIIMLTARSEELDRVLGLELGADDYITKPFGIRELIARIKAVLRRIEVDQSHKKPPEEKLIYGDLAIDISKRKVTIREKAVDLTAKEFDLLELFARNPGKAFSRQELLDQIWGYQFEGYDHTVNSHINRLRNKIEQDPSNPLYLKTVWGIGYRFIEPEELDA